MNDAELYARSPGRNINLWTCLLMLVLGSFMLLFPYLAYRKRSKS